jgi:hypothetical protein
MVPMECQITLLFLQKCQGLLTSVSPLRKEIEFVL